VTASMVWLFGASGRLSAVMLSTALHLGRKTEACCCLVAGKAAGTVVEAAGSAWAVLQLVWLMPAGGRRFRNEAKNDPTDYCRQLCVKIRLTEHADTERAGTEDSQHHGKCLRTGEVSEEDRPMLAVPSLHVRSEHNTGEEPCSIRS